MRADVTPSLLRATALIAVVKASLAVAGFERTLGWIRRRVEREPARDGDPARVAAAEYAVAMAAALYPGRALCLERSLALYWQLRGRGVAVRFRMGVQMYPFAAHAWVEHRGAPINDVAEHVQLFRPIEGVGT